MSLEQLNAARQLVKSNPEQYPSLVRGVLPVGDRPESQIRLWCSGFVADFFGAEEISSTIKDEIAVEVLEILKVWVQDSNRGVAKLGVCILSEVYPRIYRQTWYKGPEVKDKWDAVSNLKLKALERWNKDAGEGLIVACIKLAQVVVLVHQQVAHQHPVLDNVLLTAEAAGLLDRLLAIFPNDQNVSFGVLSATLNATVSLALAQPQLAPRIVSYILTFDLSKRSLGTPQQQPLILRWTGKLFKLALHPLSRNFPQVQKYLGGLSSYCANESLKRRAEDESEPTAKRQKLSSNDLAPGPQPYKALYTLVDNLMSGFYARDLQFDLAVSMASAGLSKISTEDLDERVATIKKRLSNTAVQGPVPTETTEQPVAAEKLAQTASKPESVAEPEKEHSSSNQPAAPQPSEDATDEVKKGPSRAALEVKVPEEFKQFNIILNRLLGEAPIRVVARLSARGLGAGTPIKEFTQKKLYAQLVPDFRSLLEPLVLWLSEEYYAEGARDAYFDLVSRLVDEIIPKLEISDSRTFVRLLSELPELNREIIFKIRSSCLDPERSIVGARALKFLIMFKEPCREDCLDLVEELVREGVQSVKGILEKYRPNALVEQSDGPKDA